MACVVRIRILPHGAELSGQGPVRLLDLADEHERAAGLSFSCRGANCGVCRVRVVHGAELLELASTRERDTLRFAHAADDERLGCQLSVRADADGVIELELSSTAASAGS